MYWVNAKTIGERIANGPTSGFDYLRICLAVSVVAWHTVIVCYGADADAAFWTTPLRPILYFVLPSFFALSGFLVSGSLFRNTIPAFLTLRALRIFPALMCEVFISALILGPLLTSAALHEYFTDPKFFAYFLNMTGRIHYQLPGLFLDSPFPNNVNLQLWTIPFELECYIAITGLALVGIARRPWLYLLAFIAASVALYASGSFELDAIEGSPSGRACVLAFLAGVLLYIWRDRVPYKNAVAAVAAMVAYQTLIGRGLEVLAPLPIAYLTVWLGLQNPRKLFIIAGADYSYGVYLYGFPIQQSVAYLLPDLRVWYIHLPLSVAGAFIAAAFSWTFIESKILRRKSDVLRLIPLRTAGPETRSVAAQAQPTLRPRPPG